MAPSSSSNRGRAAAVGLGIAAAAMATLLLWYALRSPGEAAEVGDAKAKRLDEEEEEEASEEAEAAGKKSRDIAGGTPRKSNVAIGGDDDGDGASASASASRGSDAGPSESSSPSSDSKALHSRIESIDKRGKALFKAKKYMEAAAAFTEALDLIASSSSSSSEDPDSPSLSRQAVTLTNNRSAMYEKGGLPDLALADCDSILEREPGHQKARTRKLRILEGEGRHSDALVEVCALQLRFMQENRDKLRMGIPVPPPVPQSKIEELMGNVLPGEIERYLEKIKSEKRERPLPSDHTIVQLLQSFTGFNAWMREAAGGGTVPALTEQIDECDNDLPKRVGLLLKRGKRHAYERSFSKAKDDFEAAYKLVQDGGDDIIDSLEGDTYPRLLEWVGMSRHLRYDLDGALACYERCSELEPANAELLVKRAGVKMDGGDHDGAAELFESALGLDPDAVDALLHRANLNMLRGKPQDARRDLERCLELRPDHLLARLRLTTVLMASEDLEGARRSLDAAQELDPDSSEAHSYRGEMHFARGDFEEARKEFDRAIECEGGNPTPYVNAALAVMNTPTEGRGPPDVAEAVRLLERAVEVDPQFHAAYVHLGQLRLSTATDLKTARGVVALYDRGLEHCRTAEELRDIVSMRLLTVAQIDAASALKMETLNMQ